MTAASSPSQMTTPPATEPALRLMPMPADLNSAGDVFGGWVMAMVDIAGALPAIRRARSHVVTMAVNSFVFKQPISVGDVVSFHADVVAVGKSSITVDVHVFAERHPADPVVVKVTEARMTYVAVDREGCKRVVGPESTSPPGGERPPADKELVLRVVPMPADLNPSGDVFGGWIMSMVDIAGAVPAIRVARSKVATVAVDSFVFKQPVSTGDIVSFHAEVVRVGRTSITVDVEVYAQRHPENPVVVKVTEARLTYVAVDEFRAKRTIGAGCARAQPSWPRTQRTMSAAPIAPAWRATSRPPRNRARVGMLRMPKRAASAWLASVSSLARRTCGSSMPAACAKAGAIVRQGPHHGAQKSTSTGMSLRPT